MNSYCYLIEMQSPLNLHFFNTWFFGDLVSKGYTPLIARYTRRKSLFLNDIVVVPIHIGNNHWMVGVIDFKKRLIQAFDSLRNEEREKLVYKVVFL